jgi:YaiO family outer membrane protein
MSARRSLGRFAIALVLAALCLSRQADAQSAAELYRQGVEARLEQRFEEATEALLKAAELQPDNADIFVQLGFSQLGAGALDAAAASFTRALDLAPDYHDARYGLALVAFRRGNLDEARRLTGLVVEAQPDNQEALDLSGSIDAAIAASQSPATRSPPPPSVLAAEVANEAPSPEEAPARERKWRLDVGSEYSALTAGRGSWTDSIASLAYRLSAATTLSGAVRVATRPAGTDVQIQTRIDHAFNPRFSSYGSLAATPAANFLASYSLGAGASWRAIERSNGLGPIFVTVDARHDFYPASGVTTIAPGLQVFLFSERLGLSGRWIFSTDHAGATTSGYMVRLDATATDRLRIFAGYADAPEISAGAVVATRTVFGGLSFDVTEALALRANVAHETRAAFDRTSFGLGLTRRF